MTGERELLAGESERGGEGVAVGGPDWVRAGKVSAEGVKKPTWRTLGSMTVREARRASMESESQSSCLAEEEEGLGFQRKLGYRMNQV